MKKKIKDYIYVADTFGPMDMQHLMHPIKEAKDAYMLLPKRAYKKILEKEYPEDLDLAMKVFKKLGRHFWYMDVYVSGKMEYKYSGKLRSKVVINLEIEEFDLCPQEVILE